MKKKRVVKLVCSFLAMVILVSSLTGCSSKEDKKAKLVKIAVVVSNQTPAAIAMNEIFKKEVEALTGGRYDIQIYDSGVLGAEKVTYDYTKSGIIEMCVVGTSMWSETPTMTIPDFPFVFRDVEHARKSYQGDLGEYIKKDLESGQPVKLLSWMPNGARAFSSNKKLTRLDDFKGQKLRMPNNPIHVKLGESLGASVVIMDMGEIFTALEQGVVDGQDNPVSTLKNEGWYEVQDYVYNTNHIISSLELFAGDEFWNSLPEEDKGAFEAAAKKASDYAWDLYMEQLQKDVAFLEESGLKVTELSQEERNEMRTRIQPVYDYLDKQYEWAKDVRNMIDGIE